MATPIWHALSPEQVLNELKAEKSGLSAQQVQQRLAEYGANRLQEAKRISWPIRLLLQFHNPLIYALLVSAAITAILGLWTDTIMIAAAAIINALIGYFQENKAEKALKAIHELLAPTATVLRDGVRHSVPATALVPGDVILLKSGDRVPADCRIIDATNCRVNEALLTGESDVVDKKIAAVSEATPLAERACMLYAATTIVYGTAQAVVVTTGKHTEIGKIGTLLKSVPKLKTPLLRQLEVFTRRIIYVIVGLAIATFLYGTLVKHFSPTDMFASAVALAVAAIPEGLPAVLSIILAIAVMRMTRQKAIVRHLPAIETLSSVSVICTDKTGTLTRNEMTVTTIVTTDHTYNVTGSGYEPNGKILLREQSAELSEHPELQQLITIGALCNDAQLRFHDKQWLLHGDPVDGALLTLAHKAQFDRQRLRSEFPEQDSLPFESQQQYMATLHQDKLGNQFIALKGAPETILKLCSSQFFDRALDTTHWHHKIDELTKTGQRVIAIAKKALHTEQQELHFDDIRSGFTLLGLVGCQDAAREDVKAAVEECQAAGIQVKMVTGDHAATALSVAKQVGIDTTGGVLTGTDIEALSDQALIEAVAKTNIFARTLPEQKLRLVQAMQATGQTIAMTGDGVNDAPALKLANIGIAMGQKGSEVAREAAEIVLADDHFTTIKEAVKEGRTVYANLKKALFFMLPTSAAEALVVTLAIAFGQTLLITPVQILWVNMITAVTLAISIAFEPSESDVMKEKPRHPKEPLFSKLLVWRIFIVAFIMLVGIFSLFWWRHLAGDTLATARAIAVNAIIFAQVSYAFNSRRIRKSVWRLKDFFGNRSMLIAIGIVILFQLLMTYTAPFHHFFGVASIKLVAWAGLIVFMVIQFCLIEFFKKVRL